MLLEFLTFSGPGVRWVLLGSTLLGAAAGAIGCFAFLKKRSLVGDALAHAALPGVTTAFLLFQTRDPVVMLLGSLASCFLGYLTLEFLTKFSKIKDDSALAIVLSFFFALGILQLTYIQKLPLGSQAGLDSILFGQAASLVKDDVLVLGGVATVILLFIIFCFRSLTAICFDPVFARASQIAVKRYEFLLALCLVGSIVIGLQLVGVVLIAALVLTPAAAARYWTHQLKTMVLVSALIGVFAGVFGSFVSYVAPRMPTGPWMVVGVTTVFVISLVFGRRRGLWRRYRKQRRLKRRIIEENILRTLFKIGEASGAPQTLLEPTSLLEFRNLSLKQLEAAIGRLCKKDFIESKDACIQLTELGLQRAEELTRLHRLWELYLLEAVHIAPDHVHEDAEEMEHMLSPEMEERLRQELSSVKKDPHGKIIPGVTATTGEAE